MVVVVVMVVLSALVGRRREGQSLVAVMLRQVVVVEGMVVLEGGSRGCVVERVVWLGSESGGSVSQTVSQGIESSRVARESRDRKRGGEQSRAAQQQQQRRLRRTLRPASIGNSC